ncbi:MAG TPA: hypothetical protein VGB45_08925 [Abditibacterium sp.]|jgi:hypothetical protein
MRFKSSLLVLGLVAASFGVVQAAPVRKIVPKGAVSFTSKEQRFAVWFPVQPRQSSGAWFIGGGVKEIEPNSFTFETSAKPIRYWVKVTIKLAQGAQHNAKKELRQIQQEFLDYPQDKFQKQEEIQLSGFSGREIQASWLDGKETTRARLYLTPKHLYEIVAVGKKAEMQKQAAQINRVFDSFRILPQK